MWFPVGRNSGQRQRRGHAHGHARRCLRIERLESRALLAAGPWLDFQALESELYAAEDLAFVIDGRGLPGPDYDHNSSASMPESEGSLLPPAQTQYSMGEKSQPSAP